MRIGIVTVSDRASAGTYEDRGGPAIVDYFQEVCTSPWEPDARLIPDNVSEIAVSYTHLTLPTIYSV